MASRIERIRAIWPNEERDFTPWLAQNLHVLSDALGLQLERPRCEVPVGLYSLDMFAVDALSDDAVAIENQIDESNHSHLGQLLTYASGLGAQKAIWIASEFSPEHLRALDDLNRTASGGREFFAVVFDVPARATPKNPAVKFTVVLTPDRKKTPPGKAPARNRGGKYDRFARDVASLLGSQGFTPANSARVPAKAHASERFFFGGYRDNAVSYNLSVEAGEIRAYLFHHGGRASERRALHDRFKRDELRIKEALANAGQQSGFRIKHINPQGIFRWLIGVSVPGSIDTPTDAEAALNWLTSSIPTLRRVLEPQLREFLNGD